MKSILSFFQSWNVSWTWFCDPVFGWSGDISRHFMSLNHAEFGQQSPQHQRPNNGCFVGFQHGRTSESMMLLPQSHRWDGMFTTNATIYHNASLQPWKHGSSHVKVVDAPQAAKHRTCVHDFNIFISPSEHGKWNFSCFKIIGIISIASLLSVSPNQLWILRITMPTTLGFNVGFAN